MATMSAVLPSQLLDQDFGFLQCVEDLRIQELITELAVEAFAVPILPWTAGLDLEWLHIQPIEPVPYGLGHNSGPWTEKLGEKPQHVVAIQPSRHQDCQTFATELVAHDQHLKRAFVMSALLDEVISPDVMAPARSMIA